MKATFENSVNVLVRAYLNDTLQHNNCYACAVGNLVANAKGLGFYKSTDWLREALLVWEGAHPRIDYPSSNHSGDRKGGWYDVLRGDYSNEEGVCQINSTGYTISQISRIESAFEKANPVFASMSADPFPGLLAVVDVLADIHGVDLSTKQAAIGQFEEVHQGK